MSGNVIALAGNLLKATNAVKINKLACCLVHTPKMGKDCKKVAAKRGGEIANARYLHKMAPELLQISYSLSNIKAAAQRFWASAREHKIWAIEGGMGAGKTTFIHALCDVLRVEDAVSSPTFSIINEYHFNDAGADATFYHMDWYRLRDEEEARAAGAEDCLLQRDTWCAVEWPSNAPGLLSSLPHLILRIKVLEGDERQLSWYPSAAL